MKSQFDETSLSSFIDGELDIQTMREVEALLASEDDARQYVLDSVRTSAFLRAEANRTLHEEVPDRLVHTLDPRPMGNLFRDRGFYPLLRIAAVVLFVVLGFGGGTLFKSGTAPLLPLWAPFPAEYSQVINETLEKNLSGTSREWHEPRASSSVRVTPLKTYRDKSGRYYRQYRLEIRSGGERREINALAYRITGGEWKTETLFIGQSNNMV